MGGLVPFPPAAISVQDILDAQHGRKFIYIWGWARYFDVFPDTPEHLTRFCWQVLIVGDPTSADSGEKLRFDTIHHTAGNCADDACPGWVPMPAVTPPLTPKAPA
jgi:hypothetical protein